ncbi:lanthionine synthetase LanC family protein [Rhodanobacter sp. 7MK24]|uniref:lanthionine synthetase LanC family protein n=1 Tax=Rhodanobacter sp. 7MK24 TaxID=2775922 RepID=UPI001CE150D0|nr:lanthionine synthetase LanC family protein [Rhodanobacter sp. 7MK24]
MEAARRLNNPALLVKSVTYVERAMELINERPASSSLYQSLPGVAWTVHAISKNHSIEGAAEVIEDANQVILASTQAIELDANLDVINGVAGIIIYALRCMTRDQQKVLFHNIGQWLTRRFNYWSSDDPISTTTRRSPETNLGVAHGVPGLLSVLAKANQKKLLEVDLQKLVKDGFDFIWNFSVPEREGGCYMPHFQDLVTQGRLAWCYGSLGVSFAYLAASATWSANNDRANQLIASSVLQYEHPSSQLNDASLCHGTSGAAFLFSKLANNKNINDEIRLKASGVAEQAIVKSMSQAIWSDNYVTFPYKSVDGITDPASFLEGRYGVALALDATERDEMPIWAEWLAV